ncbi:class I SAM-dependent methyltransferase [Curtobacterium ammoniigenes]|uniref:class I SAM-dependent methyltransferase n=1 Tax=Curtobacterium ammoniigenes TaxID=395387 RepID=UPI00082F8195|nr:class I SAM-dependent methyltransferase [Curtobacterium ammoniigenes]
MSGANRNDDRDRQAHSFGAVAATYEAGRPGYPDAASRWIVPPHARRVVDVGAGTGKFTRALLPLADEVAAVEPDPGMRAELARSVPGIRILDGSGERIPLPDASADSVTFAQAWHWVDVPAASREVARVLRPGGTLGLVWNVRDESVPWVAHLSTILDGPAMHAAIATNPPLGAPFDPSALEHRAIPWVNEQTRDEFFAMIESRSYIITMPDAERQAVLARVGRLLDDEVPHTSGGRIPVPYTTHVYRVAVPPPSQ